MKRWLVIFMCVAVSQIAAQSKVEERLQNLSKSDAKGWLQPAVNGFGMGMNSGFFHTAKTHSLLGFDLKIPVMLAQVPSGDKTFNSSVYGESPTVAGDKGSSSDPIRGLDLSLVPFVAPQLTVGVPFKTDVLLRYVPKTEISKDVGEVSMLGLGVKHNLNQWIPIPLPLDLAGAFTYTSLEVGDYLTANATSYHLLASKSLLLLTVYGGLSAESSTMDVEYDRTGFGTQKFSATGKNKFRFYGGATLKLLLIYVNADYSLGAYNAASVGLGVTLR